VTERTEFDDTDDGLDDTEQYVEELEQYRRRLDGAMFAGDLAWWEMDVESGAVTFHENKADMLGFSPAEFDHYEDFTALVHPEDHERAMEAMRRHLQGDAEKYDVEYRIRDADGDYRWFHDVGGVTKRNVDGDPLKVTGVVIDITRRKQVEEDLRRKNDQFSLLNRIVRHDIRNDMSVITGWTELLRDELPAESADKLDRIYRASQHTAELTEEVRDIMELLEGDASFDRHPVSLKHVLTDEIKRVRTSFDRVEVRVEEIPDVQVRANAMLSSVFGNLLNNAVQHNDAETVRISIETEHTDGRIRVRIADNGPGIPEQQRIEIFEKDTKGLESEGTGLGLYLVETLVTAYGGDVWITDNEPKGAVFTVELEQA
jgi:PAS domain S-box-containing protein